MSIGTLVVSGFALMEFGFELGPAGVVVVDLPRG